MGFGYTFVIDAGKVKSLIVPATIVFFTSLVSGCTISNGGIDDAVQTSAISIADSTPSIASSPFKDDASTQDAGATDRLLDEDTIRLAVTTADLAKVDGGGIPWANEATGSSGTISNIAQRKESGQACRSFDATRQAYDGVSLYKGDVCLDKRSGWWTRLLRPLGDG